MNSITIGSVFLLVGFALWVCGCGAIHHDSGEEFAFDSPAAGGRRSPSFQNDILPMLTQRCAIAGCHVENGPHGIDLRSYESLRQGGERGAVVIAGDARASELVEEITEGKMPPEGNPPLSPPQIQLIIDWVNGGAENN